MARVVAESATLRAISVPAPSGVAQRRRGDVDAVITTDVTTLHRMWQYRETVRDAVRAGRVEFDGPPALTRRLPQLLTLRPAQEMGVDAAAPHPQVHVP
jgi:hypothetical protein